MRYAKCFGKVLNCLGSWMTWDLQLNWWMEGCVKMTWRWYACTTTADRLLYLHIYAQSRKHKPFANKTAPIGPYTSTQTCFCDEYCRWRKQQGHTDIHLTGTGTVSTTIPAIDTHTDLDTRQQTRTRTLALYTYTHEHFMIVPLDSSTQSLPFHTIFTPFLTR